MGEVIKIHENTPDPQPVEVHHQMLHELSINPNLEHFQVVCHWKNGKSTSGWSENINSLMMMFGCAVLEEHSKKTIFYYPGD